MDYINLAGGFAQRHPRIWSQIFQNPEGGSTDLQNPVVRSNDELPCAAGASGFQMKANTFYHRYARIFTDQCEGGIFKTR